MKLTSFKIKSTGASTVGVVLENGVLVGAPGDPTDVPETGAAYLFDSTTGEPLRTFQNPTPDTKANFGNVAAIGEAPDLVDWVLLRVFGPGEVAGAEELELAARELETDGKVVLRNRTVEIETFAERPLHLDEWGH